MHESSRGGCGRLATVCTHGRKPALLTELSSGPPSPHEEREVEGVGVVLEPLGAVEALTRLAEHLCHEGEGPILGGIF
jgi:hypothetical protein